MEVNSIHYNSPTNAPLLAPSNPIRNLFQKAVETLSHKIHSYSASQKLGGAVLVLAIFVSTTVLVYRFFKQREKNQLISALNQKARLDINGPLSMLFKINFNDDEGIAKLAVANNPEFFSYLSERLRDNEEIAFSAIKEAFIMASYMSVRLKKDSNFALKVLPHNRDLFGFEREAYNSSVYYAIFTSPTCDLKKMWLATNILKVLLRTNEPRNKEACEALVTLINKYPSKDRKLAHKELSYRLKETPADYNITKAIGNINLNDE